MSGKVILVGAGPGDPELLTLKGKAAISAAQVVVFDRLVAPEILAMMPEDAEKIDVGKRSSNHPVPQDEINRILLEKALEGKAVVRLKGGDPFLFGRGGEELELLAEHSVGFEVVPGVTSALSVPAYAGIPVTHRDFVSSLHIITGHARAGKGLDIDFEALVRLKGTLIFLMGVASLNEICEGLIGAGMDPDYPAAVIERGTTAMQRSVHAGAGALAAKAREKNIESPAISVFGEVCALSEKFGWFEALPLIGKRIVVTRPKARIGTLSGRLRSLGAQIIECPCIETAPLCNDSGLTNAIKGMGRYEWLVFTSAAGVDIFSAYLRENRLDGRHLGPVKLAAIGPGTEKALNDAGFFADYLPEIYDAAHLGEGLARIAVGEVLILRAKNGSPELTRCLDNAGVRYRDVAIYETLYKRGNAALSRDAVSNADCVMFTSASTVNGFAGALGEDFDYSKVKGLCIGHQTAAEAHRYGINAVISDEATIDSMIKKLLEEESTWI